MQAEDREGQSKLKVNRVDPTQNLVELCQDGATEFGGVDLD